MQTFNSFQEMQENETRQPQSGVVTFNAITPEVQNILGEFVQKGDRQNLYAVGVLHAMDELRNIAKTQSPEDAASTNEAIARMRAIVDQQQEFQDWRYNVDPATRKIRVPEAKSKNPSTK